MTLSRRLAENIRKRRGDMKQRVFARKIKVHYSLIQRLESGEHNPTLKTLEELMRAFKCDIKDLF